MRASQQLFTKGQEIGILPLKHTCEFQTVFNGIFPRHLTTYLSDARNDEATMVVYPPLTLEEREKWDQLYEITCALLGFDQTLPIRSDVLVSDVRHLLRASLQSKVKGVPQ